MSDKSSRRDFIQKSATVAAGAALATKFGTVAHAAGSEEIKVVLIGCGGRGTGAVGQIFSNQNKTKLVAVADAFKDKAENSVRRLQKHAKGTKNSTVDVPSERIFAGLDAYKKAIDSDCDLVVIATPPGFKPQQFEYAVKQNKHIFCEKPMASDAPGCRRVLAAVEQSKQKNLMVGIGLQRRHEGRYVDCIKAVQDGVIGDLTALRVYWNGGGIWYRGRSDGQTEMQFQCNNWYHFVWACGDQICEQHIHNLDVGCWAKGMYPIEANGMGGAAQRMDGTGKQSQIFDHTFVEYTFPDGTKMFSQGRHLRGAWTNVSEFAHGTKGVSPCHSWYQPTGKDRVSIGKGGGGHQQEQHDLINALVAGNIYNEGEYGAKSTFTAVLGREACYSGKVVKWDKLLAEGHDYCPGIDTWTENSPAPAKKDKDGKYMVAVPGKWNPYA